MIPLLWALLGGCADDPREPVVVFAAASLTDAFRDLEAAYEAEHPGADVQLVSAGSQVLRLQIAQGAPADVVASADPRHLDALVASGDVAAYHPLAQNELVVIVPSDDTGVASIDAFAALDQAERLVVGADGVPVGDYTRQLLTRAGAELGPGFLQGVEARVVSRESNARLVRAKVQLGEADAAVVYRTDANDDVRVIEVPSGLNVRATYGIAPVVDAAHGEAAHAFVTYTRSPAGQRILAAHGFLPAPGTESARR